LRLRTRKKSKCPSRLPVQAPTKYEPVINLKAANSPDKPVIVPQQPPQSDL